MGAGACETSSCRLALPPQQACRVTRLILSWWMVSEATVNNRGRGFRAETHMQADREVSELCAAISLTTGEAPDTKRT